jgi:hypothetical protein
MVRTAWSHGMRLVYMLLYLFCPFEATGVIFGYLIFCIFLCSFCQAAGLGDMNPPLSTTAQDPMKCVLTGCRRQNDSATSTRQLALLVPAP